MRKKEEIMIDIIRKIEALGRGQALLVNTLGPLSTIFPQWSKIKKVSEDTYEYKQRRYVGVVHKIEIPANERRKTNGVVMGKDEEGKLLGEKFYVFLTTRAIAKTFMEEK